MPVQTSSRPSRSHATAFIGSIVAWARKGTRYSASSIFPVASPCVTLPSLRMRLSWCWSSNEATMALKKAAVVLPCTGPAHSHCTARAAWNARQVLSAITATPPGNSTTCNTPRIAFAALASKCFNAAPMAGFRRAVAKTISGS